MRTRKINYQQHAIEVISSDINYYLQGNIDYYLQGNLRKYGLKAPTGSGKSLMSARIIKEVSSRRSGDVAFVFITIGSGELPIQAKKSLTKELTHAGIRVYDVKSSVTSCTAGMRNCVVVAAWETLNRHDRKNRQRTNIVMKEGDTLSFPEVCTITREAKVPIVLVIDESHIAAETAISQEVIDLIGPSYILYVSATLRNKVDFQHTITYREVADEQMVKDSIHVTTFPEFREGVRNGADKVKELIGLAQGTGAKFSPKALLFLPNDSDKSVEIEAVLDILQSEYGWTEASGDVKIVLSKRKTAGWELTKGEEGNEDKTKIIITKEAIATGVDIPSISVIIQMRPIGSSTVYLQKLGRGLRMPEKKHYKGKFDFLNTLYYFVEEKLKLDFADVEDLEERQCFTSSIREKFKTDIESFTKLPGSYYDRHELLIEADTDLFEEIFYQIFLDNLKFRGRAGFAKWDRTSEFDVKFGVMNYDEEKYNHLDGYKVMANDRDIDNIYDAKYHGILKHSWKHEAVIRDAILAFMQPEVNDGMPVSSEYVKAFMINNIDAIHQSFEEAREKSEIEYDKGRVRHTFDYAPPDSYDFVRNPKITVAKPTVKCLYEPYYLDNEAKRSDTEDQFADWLDSHSNVLWWAKNYDRKYGDSYSTTYNGTDKKDKVFFPDFIGQLTDGRTFVLEVKAGTSDSETDNKNNALIDAVGNNTICGIVRYEIGWYLYRSNDKKERMEDCFLIPAK